MEILLKLKYMVKFTYSVTHKVWDFNYDQKSIKYNN